MGDDSEQPTDPYAPNMFQLRGCRRAFELCSYRFFDQDERCDACSSIMIKTPRVTISGSTTLRLALPQLAAALLSVNDEVFLSYEEYVNGLTMNEREALKFVTSRCLTCDVRVMVVNVCTDGKSGRLYKTMTLMSLFVKAVLFY